MRILAVVVLCVACVACKKDEPKSGAGEKPAVMAKGTDTRPGTASANGKGTAGSGSGLPMVPAGKDPWAGPPPEAKTAAGTKLGGQLSKIDDKDDPWSQSSLPRKVDVQAIAAPPIAQVGLSSFTHAGSATASGGFTVTYNTSTNPTHEQFRDALQKQHVFETVAENLNKTVRIPHVVPIQGVDCNTVNAFYDPSSGRIIVCYELIDYFFDVFKGHAKNDEELGNAVLGATTFSMFHEAGHGLIHQLDLPAVGREEDSVDQLATLILIAGGDDGVKQALSGAYWFQLQSQGSDKTPFWDEHGFDGQRFYNIMCLIYGSNPDKYKGFVDSGNLPAERAAKCPAEYAKIDKAWEKLLQPYLTNGAAVNVDYKPEVPQAEAPRTTSKDPWGDSDSNSGDSTTHAAPIPPPPPPAAGITCEQVADKASELVQAEAESHAGELDEDGREKLQEKIKTELPSIMQQVLAQCAKEKWSESSRKCVMAATSLDAAGHCQ